MENNKDKSQKVSIIKRITNEFLQLKFNKQEEAHLFLYFTGHGEFNAGWKLSDDKIVTFCEIRGLWEEAFGKNYRGKKHLIILNDCCYSGQWCLELKNNPISNISMISSSEPMRPISTLMFTNLFQGLYSKNPKDAEKHITKYTDIEQFIQVYLDPNLNLAWLSNLLKYTSDINKFHQTIAEGKHFIVWRKEWKFPSEGKGSLRFTSAAKRDILIAISDQMKETNHMIFLVIGGGKNSYSSIRVTPDGQNLIEVNKQIDNTKAECNFQIEFNDEKLIVTSDNNEIFAIEKNKLQNQSWIRNFKYFGLSWWADKSDFSSIQYDSKTFLHLESITNFIEVDPYWEELYCDWGTKAIKDMSVWYPKVIPQGSYNLGCAFTSKSEFPKLSFTKFYISPSNPNLVMPADRWEKIWEYRGNENVRNGSIWHPVPPKDFISLGSVAIHDCDNISNIFSNLCCVHISLVEESTLEEKIWTNEGIPNQSVGVEVWTIKDSLFCIAFKGEKPKVYKLMYE